MEISKEDFFSSAQKSGIPKHQIEAVWESLESENSRSAPFAFSKLILYFGALIVISAMTWLMTQSWEWFGGGGMFLISIAYFILFGSLGMIMWKKKDLKVPAGLLITIAVCMTPLAIYGLETYFNVWPSSPSSTYKDFYHMIRSSWIFMELGTMIVGLVALRFFPFPFLTVPIFISAWFFILDATDLILGKETTWRERDWVILHFGIALILISYVIDRIKGREYAFWGYLFGTFTFWGSLTSLIWDKNEYIYFGYLVISVLLMIVSILLNCRVFMVFGALGAMAYFSHLAFDVFKDSVWFPFALSFIGLMIIFLGILYQKNIGWIEKSILSKIPDSVKKLLPRD